MRRFRSIGICTLLLGLIALPVSWAGVVIGVGVSVHIGPPALPVYAQPICPGPGYLWTPGYWAYGDAGYYWVPGTWIVAPAAGLLWTPGYWGWGGGGYLWHAGYWGPHVGFYGGVNYGFGYGGVGFVGGRWNGGVFAYNAAVMNVNTTVIRNTYVDRTVVNNVTVNRVSYNGGAGGINARPNAQEQAAMQEHHTFATTEQAQHERLASSNHALLASVNHGRPAIAATSRPGDFSGHGAMAAHDSAPRPMGNSHNVPRPSNQAQAQPASVHGNGDTHGAQRPAKESHGNGGGEHHGGSEPHPEHHER